MADILTQLDTDFNRVGVTLSGFPTDGPITVYRVHPGGVRYAVRALSQVSGGAAFAWDYEAPFGVPVTYTTDQIFTRTNLIDNPSFATDLTGWAAGTSATLTRDITTGWIGSSSGLLDNTLAFGYAQYTPKVATTPDSPLTISAYVKGTGYAKIEARGQDAANATTVTASSGYVTLTSSWQRVSVTVVPDATTTKVWPLFFQQLATGTTYLDGVMAEETAQLRDYINPSESTTIESDSVTIATSAAWLRSPGLPALDLSVELLDVPPSKRERPRVVLRPFGRTSALVLSDTAKSAEFQLVLRTYGYQQAEGLIDLFQGTPVALLLMPGAREPYRYVSLGNLVEEPLVKYRAADGTNLNDPGGISEWSLDCVVTSSPIGGLYGDPTASYDAVLTGYATFTSVRNLKATYLELLKGV